MLGEPAFDVKECQQRGLTFASPLRARVRLGDHGSRSTKETIKEVKEQEVYMGEIPLMTTTGSFVINGTERVIVSQLHRSPGVFFEHDAARPTVRASCCSRPASFPIAVPGWTSNSIRRTYLYFRVDRRRKMPVTILLKAIGMTPSRSWPPSSSSTPFIWVQEGHSSSKSCPSACAAKWRSSTSRQGRQGHRRQGQAHHRQAHPRAGRGGHQEDRGAGRVSSSAASSAATQSMTETGEILANANDEITEELLAKLSESRRRQEMQTLYVNDLDRGAYISSDAAHRRDGRPVASRVLPSIA
jgi:DNA-directed RNA polymerase subunit beta